MEAYIDDVVIKTRNRDNPLANLKKTFTNLRRFSKKLNPNMCVFRVSLGQLLGFIVSERGIEANPKKIKAIIELEPPETVHEVQKLTGCVAALSRFISRLGEKALLLYRLLRKGGKFH